LEKLDIIKSIENDSTRAKMEADLAEASRIRTELEVKLETIKEEMEIVVKRMEDEKINAEIELKKMKDQQEDIQEKEKVDLLICFVEKQTSIINLNMLNI